MKNAAEKVWDRNRAWFSIFEYFQSIFGNTTFSKIYGNFLKYPNTSIILTPD